MTLATLVALTLFLLPLQLSPGPANLYFASLAGRFGVQGAVPASAGYLTAAFALTLLIGLGLKTAVFGGPELMRPMQLAGALVLLLCPKADLIVALTLAQFAKDGQTSVCVVLVGMVVVLTYILLFVLWAGASAGVGRTLGARRLNVLYAASVTLTAVRGRRPAERSTLLPR